MPLGTGSANGGLSGSAESGSGVTATLTRGTPGATSVPLTLALSAGATLVSWSVQRRKSGGAWSTIATGLTDLTYTATGLDPKPAEYDFQADVVVQEAVTSNVVAVTTTEAPPVPLVQWAQIDGGDDLGSNINGGGSWFWNNAGPATFAVIVRNRESFAVDAVQIPVETTSGTPGSHNGYAVQQGAVWTSDTTVVTPPAGSWESPGIALAPIIELSTPIAANGGEITFQQELSAGIQTPGKNFGSKYHPETGQTALAGMEVGAHLATSLDYSGVSIGPFAPKMFMRLVDAQIYALGLFGDSTVGMVQPVDSPTTDSKEGVWFWANEALRALSVNVRAYSYGQGTANWAQIQSRVRAHLAAMQGKISRVCIQVWSWNSSWTTLEQVATAWAEYLVLEAEVKAAGFACSPLLLHPYTTRTGAGQPEAFLAMKANVVAHPEGIALDEITGGASWPNLPSGESEDNVHQNQTGAKRSASAVAAALRATAAIDYPEFA